MTKSNWKEGNSFEKNKSIVSLLLVTAIILGNITGTVPAHAEKNIGTEFFDNCFKTAEITETQNNNATPSAIKHRQQ